MLVNFHFLAKFLGQKCALTTLVLYIIWCFTAPTVQLPQSSYSVNTGSQVTLACTVTSSSPLTSVFWQRNVNGFVTTISSTTNTNKYSGSTTSVPSLTIFDASNSDIGIYTCFATNAFGTGSSPLTTSLTVISKLFLDVHCKRTVVHIILHHSLKQKNHYPSKTIFHIWLHLSQIQKPSTSDVFNSYKKWCVSSVKSPFTICLCDILYFCMFL